MDDEEFKYINGLVTSYENALKSVKLDILIFGPGENNTIHTPNYVMKKEYK